MAQDRTADGGAETHFGFSTVPLQDKQDMVDAVFHKVAGRYDLMNDLMSAGLHRAWKDALVSSLRPPRDRPFAHLDVAGGTGDVAFRVLDAAGPRAHVTVLDINTDMLAVGRERTPARLEGRVDFVEGNAEALPFPEESFDIYTIGFGLRNVTNKDKALKDAYRVLRKGGRIMVLEFSHLPHPALQAAYDAYSFNIIPKLGQAVANDAASYKYLVESIRRFPKQHELQEMVADAGFQYATHTNFMAGIVAVHSGFKL
jgi:demethylmenaquinone methyltransferase/2-methoxy-6-polyprenyl-1,4-benzoquinol methylase